MLMIGFAGISRHFNYLTYALRTDSGATIWSNCSINCSERQIGKQKKQEINEITKINGDFAGEATTLEKLPVFDQKLYEQRVFRTIEDVGAGWLGVHKMSYRNYDENINYSFEIDDHRGI